MAHEIMTQTPRAYDETKLLTELNALAIPGVRTYSILGRDQVIGVYAWDASAPVGEYQHIDLSPANQQKVLNAITAHALPAPPPDPEIELDAAIEAATTLDQLKKALLGRSGRQGKVKGDKPK